MSKEREPTVVHPRKAVHPSTVKALEKMTADDFRELSRDAAERLRRDPEILAKLRREQREKLEKAMMGGDPLGIINNGMPEPLPKAPTGTTESLLESTTEMETDGERTDDA